jgi:hypothetical protein
MTRGRLLALAIALAIVAAPGLARAQAAWLRERIDVEWVVGVGGWRASLGDDLRAPGFDALAGGGELVLGLDIGAGLGVVASGRVLAGSAGRGSSNVGSSGTYLEALGGIALQARLGRARLRAGPAAGLVTWSGDRATLLGGFVAGSIDLFALGGGRLSTTVDLRLDIDVDLGAKTVLPDQSLALALGLGLRY